MSGLLLGLSYPPFSLGFLAWIAFIPLLHCISKEERIGQKALFGFVACFTSNLIILNWMGLNSGTSPAIAIISYLALSLYLTIFWMAFIISTHFIPKKIELFLTPLSWIFFVEFLRNIGPLAGPWMNLSLTQSEYIRIIQLASIEVHAISFMVIFFNIQVSIFKGKRFYFSLERITCPDIYRAGDGVHKTFLGVEKKSKLNFLHPAYIYLEKRCFQNAKKIIGEDPELSDIKHQKVRTTYSKITAHKNIWNYIS